MVSLPGSVGAGKVAEAFENAFPGFNVTCRPTESAEEFEATNGNKGHQSWSLDLEGPDSVGFVG